eukprot:scaffold4.g4770.t1
MGATATRMCARRLACLVALLVAVSPAATARRRLHQRSLERASLWVGDALQYTAPLRPDPSSPPDCMFSCNATSLAPVLSEGGGAALCRVSRDQIYFGTVDQETGECAFAGADGSEMRDAAAFFCACTMPGDAAGLSWEPGVACPSGFAEATAPVACGDAAKEDGQELLGYLRGSACRLPGGGNATDAAPLAAALCAPNATGCPFRGSFDDIEQQQRAFSIGGIVSGLYVPFVPDKRCCADPRFVNGYTAVLGGSLQMKPACRAELASAPIEEFRNMFSGCGVSSSPSSWVSGQHSSPAGSREGGAGGTPDGTARKRKQHDGPEGHDGPEQLFLGYQVPTDRRDVPYAPARTLDVGAKAWRYYTGHSSSFEPRGWWERGLHHLLCGGTCWGRRQRQRGQQERAACGGGEGPEDGRPSSVRGPSGDEEAGWPHEWRQSEARHRHRSVFGLPMLSPGAQFTFFNVVNVAATALYVGDMAMGFHVGFVAAHDVKRALVMEGAKVADYYVRHGSFLADLLATLPIVPELVFTSIHTDTTAVKWVYTLRLLRLARVFRLLKAGGAEGHSARAGGGSQWPIWGGGVFTNPLSRWLQRWFSTAGLYLMNLAVAMTLVVNLLGCIWWFLAELEGLEDSWVAATGPSQSPFSADSSLHLLEASDPARWAASILVVIVATITTNVVNFLGDLMHSSSRAARQAEALRRKLEDVENWMRSRHIPGHLQSKVRRYFIEVRRSAPARAGDCRPPGAAGARARTPTRAALPHRGEIVSALAGEALRQSRMFNLLDEALASVALPVRLVAGHNLFEEGEEAEDWYILQQGEAASFRGTQRVTRLHGPALVGQAAIFSRHLEDARRRLHTVRAVTNCTLWRFSGARLARMLKHDPAALPPLCRSYLKTEAKLERRAAEGSAAATPSPPGSPPPEPEEAEEGTGSAGRTAAGGGPQSGVAPGRLARISLAPSSTVSEALPEGEQLQELPLAAEQQVARTAGGTSMAAPGTPGQQGGPPLPRLSARRQHLKRSSQDPIPEEEVVGEEGRPGGEGAVDEEEEQLAGGEEEAGEEAADQ